MSEVSFKGGVIVRFDDGEGFTLALTIAANGSRDIYQLPIELATESRPSGHNRRNDLRMFSRTTKSRRPENRRVLPSRREPYHLHLVAWLGRGSVLTFRIESPARIHEKEAPLRE